MKAEDREEGTVRVLVPDRLKVTADSQKNHLCLMDTDFDSSHNIRQDYGNGKCEAEYLGGVWKGDGRGRVAVRRGP